MQNTVECQSNMHGDDITWFLWKMSNADLPSLLETSIIGRKKIPVSDVK